jgi:hypothetical protein
VKSPGWAGSGFCVCVDGVQEMHAVPGVDGADVVVDVEEVVTSTAIVAVVSAEPITETPRRPLPDDAAKTTAVAPSTATAHAPATPTRWTLTNRRARVNTLVRSIGVTTQTRRLDRAISFSVTRDPSPK